MHFIYFLGRFHVVALHLPITLILVVAGLEWLRRGGRRPDLELTLRILWPATAIAAVGTVILGYMHFSEGGFTGPSATAHRALGTSVAVVSLVGWGLRSRMGLGSRRAKSAAVALLVMLVFLTGHFGGNLSHGETFLVDYAPNWIRGALGLQPARPPVTTVAAADPYLDIVQPIFAQRCVSCHNASKKRGGLDLTAYAHTIQGGENGPVIVRGNAGASDMIRRVSLPSSNDDFMPRDSQAPLTSDQIAILSWWIDAGAKMGVKVSSLKVPPTLEQLMAAQLHLGGASPAGAVAAAPQVQEIALGAAGAKADPKLLSTLSNAGFMARQISMADAHLIVSPITPGAQFTGAQLDELANAARDQVAQLNLSAAGLDDAAVAPVTQLSNLTQLRLNNDKLTDKAVRALSSLTRLTVLGLYGNSSITDASLPVIGGMKSLKKSFLWGTGVTAAGVQKLRQSRPDLTIDFGDESASPAASAPPHTAILRHAEESVSPTFAAIAARSFRMP
jgi:mono/diheme cytochrome c family protein